MFVCCEDARVLIAVAVGRSIVDDDDEDDDDSVGKSDFTQEHSNSLPRSLGCSMCLAAGLR